MHITKLTERGKEWWRSVCSSHRLLFISTTLISTDTYHRHRWLSQRIWMLQSVRFMKLVTERTLKVQTCFFWGHYCLYSIRNSTDKKISAEMAWRERSSAGIKAVTKWNSEIISGSYWASEHFLLTARGVFCWSLYESKTSRTSFSKWRLEVM